jgi:hypothetical protein
MLVARRQSFAGIGLAAAGAAAVIAIAAASKMVGAG